MSCWFNDIDDPESWIPEDSLDINEWIGVTIGDEVGGSDFQVHICTPISIRGIQEKRAIFMLDEYCGLNDLIPKLAWRNCIDLSVAAKFLRRSLLENSDHFRGKVRRTGSLAEVSETEVAWRIGFAAEHFCKATRC